MSDTHQDLQAQDEANAENLQIGGFSGFLRRPLGDRSGMTAQMYGENGPDADMISALALTKFLEADVYVKVYLIKSAEGQLMKSGGAFPLVAAFKAKVQRPKGLRDGMIANLFAPNGADADQVNGLGLSKYLDAFVFVEILKPDAAPAGEAPIAKDEAITPALSAELDEAASHLTPPERKALEKKTKLFKEANRLLKISGFFRQPAVWSKLGSELDHAAWMDGAPCCAAGDSPCPNKAHAFKIPAPGHQHYQAIPLCAEHALQAESGTLKGGLAFMRLRQDVLTQEWAIERLKTLVGTPKGVDEPDPQKVFSWAVDNGLNTSVPGAYLAKF
jgi:hypothetical protein